MSTDKNKAPRSNPFEMIRNFYILFAQFVLMGIIGILPFILKNYESGFFTNHLSKPLGFITFALVALGLLWSTWSALFMRSSLTVFITPRAKGQLIKTGPFHYSRNPIYAGLIVAAFAWAAFWGSFEVLFLVLLLFFTLRIKVNFEEQALLRKYGKEYKDYCEKTPRFFFHTSREIRR